MKKRILIVLVALIALTVIILLGRYMLNSMWSKGYDSGYNQSEIEKEETIVSIEKAYEEKEDKAYAAGYNDGLNDPINYEKGYADGYEDGYADCLDNKVAEVWYAYYSGKFTAKVICLLEDNYEIEGKSVAYLSSMYKPFIVYFDRDMSSELEEGKEYVFEIKPFTLPYIAGTSEWHFEEVAEKLQVTSFYEAGENEKGRNGLWIGAEFFKEDPLN